MLRKIPSSSFQSLPRLGHGREGVVYDLGDGKCLKVYQPDYAHVAKDEFHNFEILLAAKIRVPVPYERVTIVCDGPLLVPREQFGGRYVLKDLPDLQQIPGLIRDCVPGRPYASFRPCLEDLCALLAYLEDAKEKGFIFSDGAPENFVRDGPFVSCIDCSGVVSEEMYQQHTNPTQRFKEAALVYRNAVLHALREDLITKQICNALDINTLYSHAGLLVRSS